MNVRRCCLAPHAHVRGCSIAVDEPVGERPEDRETGLASCCTHVVACVACFATADKKLSLWIREFLCLFTAPGPFSVLLGL